MTPTNKTPNPKKHIMKNIYQITRNECFTKFDESEHYLPNVEFRTDDAVQAKAMYQGLILQQRDQAEQNGKGWDQDVVSYKSAEVTAENAAELLDGADPESLSVYPETIKEWASKIPA
jgi:hypothetical protein